MAKIPAVQRRRVPTQAWIWLAIYEVVTAVIGAFGPQWPWFLFLMPFAVGLLFAWPMGGIPWHRTPECQREPVRAKARYGTVVIIFLICTFQWVHLPFLPWIFGEGWGKATPLVAGTSYAIALLGSLWVLDTTRTEKRAPRKDL
jgi:hypothetical protein